MKPLAPPPPSLPAERFRQALALHQQGQWAAAAALYREVLRMQPRHFDALHMLGVLTVQSGQAHSGAELIRQAIDLDPGQASAYSNLGIALRGLGRLDEALACYDRAVALDAGDAGAFNNRGNVLRDLKRPQEALASYDQALRLQPGLLDALNNRGNALLDLCRPEEALACYAQALRIRPDAANTFINQGNALQSLKRHEEALACYERAVALAPGDAGAHNNRGNALRDLKRPQEALVSYGHALRLQPDLVEALNNRGNVLLDLKRPEEALACYDQAVGLKPGDAAALNHRGIALQALNRHAEALASYVQALQQQPDNAETCYRCGIALHHLQRHAEALDFYDRALRLRPDYAAAFNNRGVTLQNLGRQPEAVASYAQASRLQPDFAQAHWNESMARLLLGDYAQGFAKYEWRWEAETFGAPRRDFSQPLWLGQEPLAGKTILLHAEQGLGDTLQFCRYAKRVATQGAEVWLEAQAALKPLLANLPGVSRLFVRGEALPAFDCHCPLLSLPLACGTRLDNIPAELSYLRADPARVAQWQAKLGPAAGPKIGLAWSGNPAHDNDRNRSMPLATLLKLTVCPARFVSLYQQVRADDETVLRQCAELAHYGAELADFAETAGLVANLDLVITVDTAVAHLAAGLGKPVWLLLAFNPDWRWLLDREDSPWYPTVRLFRQTRPGDWDGVVARVADALWAIKPAQNTGDAGHS